jgi:hypothetical protein
LGNEAELLNDDTSLAVLKFALAANSVANGNGIVKAMPAFRRNRNRWYLRTPFPLLAQA